MNNRQIIKVADIPISIITNSTPLESISSGKIYKNFIFNGTKTDIDIYVHYGNMPQVSLADKKLIVGMKNIWKLYCSDKNKIFIINPVNPKKKIISKIDYIGCKLKPVHLKDKSVNSPSHRIAIFEHSLTKGDIYVKCSRHAVSLPDPLGFPLSELLMVDWLSNRQGSLFHGCGVMDSERGYA